MGSLFGEWNRFLGCFAAWIRAVRTDGTSRPKGSAWNGACGSIAPLGEMADLEM